MENIFYGPVFSRRFGYSLGIDLTPYKICSFDCIYCQLGKTSTKTTDVKRYVDIDFENFKSELKRIIDGTSRIDYITFAGSGEPTLSSDLNDLIRITKQLTSIPVIVLTNGSGFSSDSIIDAVSISDAVKISIDASDEAAFKKINKPHRSITFASFVEGIKKFFSKYEGKILIEIMLLKGLNDSDESFENFKTLFDEIPFFYDKVKKIHLNNPFRLPESYGLLKSSDKQTEKFMSLLPGKTEIIKISKGHGNAIKHIHEEDLLAKILDIINRRPSSAKDISQSLNININESIKMLTYLINEDKVYYDIKGKEKLFFLKR
ncbi:MAG: radical SAM protein [Actinomycetota bacterium]|jgi:wyosine [tRNA(Phe)-imidazoG37] synthetase (radical SAM superfamily)|nr:radical SAM protein [Actinomycetota bacterium]